MMIDEKMKQYDIVVAGSYFCDMVFTGLPEMPRMGADIFARNFQMVPGGTYYIVLILHRLGMNVGWICDFGTDFFSQFVLSEAEKTGIDTSLCRHYDEPRRFVASSFSFEHDRGFVSFEDTPYQPSSFEELSTLEFNCYLSPGVEDWRSLEMLDRLPRRKEFILFMDCQHTELTLDSPSMEEALQRVDIFAPNEREALAFTGTGDVFNALDRLAEIVPTVVIKRGGMGAIARQGQVTWQVPAIQVEVKDTTGAGDSFNAGFLYACLNNLPMEECLRYGNITGGLSVMNAGPMQCVDINTIHKMAKNYQNFCRI